MSEDKTPYKILNLLKDGQSHSGEALGAALQISQDAVWKAIQKLQALYQLNIESISEKSYQIKGGLDLLCRDRILTSIDLAKKKQLCILLLEQTSSTNDYLLQHSQLLTEHPYTVVLAEQQTAGRGRQGRPWISPFGHNIYCSLAWRCHKNPPELTGLSLTSALAVIRTLKKYDYFPHLQVKWPNDILYQDDKLGGILLDIKAESPGISNIIIGIGINTFLPPEAADLVNQRWTSLNDILHKPIDRNYLAALLINAVIDMIRGFEQFGFPAFLPEWNQYDSLLGQAVLIKQGEETIQGIMQGVSEKGELLIKNTHQQSQTFISGDVSLRKQ